MGVPRLCQIKRCYFCCLIDKTIHPPLSESLRQSTEHNMVIGYILSQYQILGHYINTRALSFNLFDPTYNSFIKFLITAQEDFHGKFNVSSHCKSLILKNKGKFLT